MGLCGSSAPIDPQAQERTESIDKYMHEDFVQACQRLAILVLGPSAGGKATLFKQLKLLYGSIDDKGDRIDPGFKTNDIAHFRRLIHMSTIANMKELVEQAPKYFSEGVLDQQAGQIFEYISEDEKFDASVETLLKRLWSDPGVQAAFENAHEFGLADSAGYFFEHETLNEMSRPKYTPTPEHILRVQGSKNGLVTLNIQQQGVDYVLHDVSAQRNRRKKWIYKFENDVRIIVFMVGMDQYNEPSRQNGAVDGVTHGLADFLELCEEPSLQKFPILVVLNRQDKFCKKVLNNPPWEYRHQGSHEEEPGPWEDAFESIGPLESHEKGAETYIPAAINYIQQKFLDIATYTKRGPRAGKHAPPVEFVVVSVLEEKGAKQVFRSMQRMLLQKSH
jgi:guanylate kinase